MLPDGVIIPLVIIAIQTFLAMYAVDLAGRNGRVFWPTMTVLVSILGIITNTAVITARFIDG